MCINRAVPAVILDNFFGRQFNSLNDASISPQNGEIYFTDPTYGYVQDFRPAPGLPKQVWRFNTATGVVRVAADGFNMPNGKYCWLEATMDALRRNVPREVTWLIHCVPS